MWKFIKENPWLFVGLAFFILLGIGLGVGLTVTGIFAPFGLSLLGLLGAGSLLFGVVATPPTIILSVLVRRKYMASSSSEVEKKNLNSDDLEENKNEVSSTTSATEGTVSSECQDEKRKDVERYGQPSSVPYVPPVPGTSTNGPQVNSNTPPQIVAATLFVAPVFVAPVASTPPKPVATEAEAELVKQRILEIVQPKDGAAVKGIVWITNPEFGKLEVVVDGQTNNAKVVFEGVNLSKAYNSLAEANDQFYDCDLESEKELPQFPVALAALVDYLEADLGQGSIQKNSKMVRLQGEMGFHHYKFSFEISPKNVKRIAHQLVENEKSSVKVTQIGLQVNPTVSSTQVSTTAVSSNSSAKTSARVPLAGEPSVSASASSEPEQSDVPPSGAGTGGTSPRGNGESSTVPASPVSSAPTAFFSAPASPPSSPQVSTEADAKLVMKYILDTFKDKALITDTSARSLKVEMDGSGARIVYTRTQLSTEFDTLSPQKAKKAATPPDTLTKLVVQINHIFKGLDPQFTLVNIQKREVDASSDNRKNQFYFEISPENVKRISDKLLEKTSQLKH